MIDRYMNGYVDRRMSAIIEEWQLARTGNMGAFPQRIAALEREVTRLSASRKASDSRLHMLEERAQKLQEQRS